MAASEYTLHIPDISCMHCVNSIANEVADVPGAEFVSGDAASKTVKLKVDSPETLERLKKALAEIGYAVE